jgi:hypothetical protein
LGGVCASQSAAKLPPQAMPALISTVMRNSRRFC